LARISALPKAEMWRRLQFVNLAKISQEQHIRKNICFSVACSLQRFFVERILKST